MYSKVKISKVKSDFMDFMLSCRIVELILYSNSIFFALKRERILTTLTMITSFLNLDKCLIFYAYHTY